jgi:hypothetical protein
MVGRSRRTARKHLLQHGIDERQAEKYRHAATIGRSAGRLFAEIYAKADSGKTVDEIRGTIVRHYAGLSVNELRKLEADIRQANDRKMITRRKYELSLHVGRDGL